MAAEKFLTDKDLLPIINKAIKDFSGDSTQLESAIGMLFLCVRLGWAPMMLIHSRATIKNYEKILGISIRDIAPKEGRMSGRSIGYIMLRRAQDFWKAVRGEIPDVRSPKIAKA
ncbi:MAG: hypothetical protein P4M15_11605 [Alphaproteobacteria bacterium]|nr:hypothetical protein [Alphaproteobacteria bacterium]